MGVHCKCGNFVTSKQINCTKCGKSYPKHKAVTNSGLSKEDKERIDKELKDTKLEIKCPKCKSNKIEAMKKGVSLKKSIFGVLALGGAGALAGLHGSNNLELNCLKCGNKWLPKK